MNAAMVIAAVLAWLCVFYCTGDVLGRLAKRWGNSEARRAFRRWRYRRYLRSVRWRMKRNAALATYGYQCATCGTTQHLEVHHVTYKRLRHERMADLQVLCGRCHGARHGYVR